MPLPEASEQYFTATQYQEWKKRTQQIEAQIRPWEPTEVQRHLIDPYPSFKRSFKEWRDRVYIHVDSAKPGSDRVIVQVRQPADCFVNIKSSSEALKEAEKREQDRLWSLVCLAAESSRYG